jgi:hypothetical protein
MTASQVTIIMHTTQNQNHIFHADVTDSGSGGGTFTALTDIITGQGLQSLEGQTITRVMAWTEGKTGQGAGILVINPQNTPMYSLNCARLEIVPPAWQSCSITPSLNWVIQVQTQAA